MRDTKAASSSPAEPLYQTATGHLSSGRLELARPHLLGALQADASHAPSLVALGSVELHYGNASTAVALLAKADAIRRDDSVTLANLATAQHLLGSNRDALATLRRLMRSDPTFNAVAIGRLHADILFDLGRMEESLQAYESAAIQAAGDPHLSNGAGNALLELGRAADAKARFLDGTKRPYRASTAASLSCRATTSRRSHNRRDSICAARSSLWAVG